MRIVNAKCGSVIPIGRLGENDAVQVIFDVASWVTTYGNGTFNLLNKRNGDANAYPCDVIEDNGKLLWVINSADVANAGYGQCEIVYIVGDTIAKSEIYTTIVGKALTGGGYVPEPWEDWVERVLQAGADVDEAVNLWQNMTAVGVEADEAFADYDNGVLTIGIPESGGGGTSDHRQLSNRDAANQHPINAITGLQSALDGKQPIGDYATTQDVSDLADIVDTKADASDIPSLDGYATEQWVENKGYLTEHQSLDGYATESYVNSHHDDTKQDVISDLDTIRSGAALGATAVQPESGKGLFSGNYNDLTNKPTIPSLAGYATEQYVDNHHDTTKQDALTAGENISIVDNVISASNGGGSAEEWELIAVATITTAVNAIEFRQDSNGDPISLRKAAFYMKIVNDTGSTFRFSIVSPVTPNHAKITLSQNLPNVPTGESFGTAVTMTLGEFGVMNLVENAFSVQHYNKVWTIQSQGDKQWGIWLPNGIIDAISLETWVQSAFGIGTMIELWGVRA